MSAAQRSSAALQAKKAELKQALAAAEAEAAACREGGVGAAAEGGSGDTQQLAAHGRKRVATPQAEATALEEDAPAPQHGGEHRTPDAHAAGIDPNAAARDQAAANGGS